MGACQRATYIGPTDARRPIVAPDEDVPLPLLERYAIGQCTPEDLAELEAWIGGRPERRLFSNRLQILFAPRAADQRPTAFTEGEIEQAWGRLAERMSAQASKERVRDVRRRRIQAAAVLCVIAGLLLWLTLARH